MSKLALPIRATTYGSIKSILQNGLDRAFAKPNAISESSCRMPPLAKVTLPPVPRSSPPG
jgi:hypothetical protein